MDEIFDYDYEDEIEDEFEDEDAAPLMIAKVREFAAKAHGNQKDKSGLPYITHLDAVAANTVRLFGYEPELVTIAYLHDLVEDTRYTQDDVDVSFPSPVADAVYAITKRTGQANYKYIGEVAKDEAAAKVKLADLLHNTDPKRLEKLSPEVQRRLRKKYYPAIFRLCEAVGIESWVTREQAEAAIRDESALATSRSITVASLMRGDQIQFVENSKIFEIAHVSPAISGVNGSTSRDVTMVDGDTLRIRSALKVTLLPRKTSTAILDKTVAQYMGEAE